MILTAKNITKYFYKPQKHLILNDVSLDVRRGELLSIYGESGSGKSTLLYILAALDIEYEGQLTFMGQRVQEQTENSLAALRNKYLGFVYQFHYLLPEFNVLQNVMLPGMKLYPRDQERVRQRALALLEEMNMGSFANRPAYKLSGGQQQRVAIARALINDPALIIADEPTGNLDKKNSTMVFDLLMQIAENKGKSVLLATHNTTIQKKSHRSFEMIDGTLRL